MIGKVVRGAHAGGLLRYLYGPGRANEHTDPHLVAAWDGRTRRLEPHGQFGPLTGLLEQPLRTGSRLPEQPVWHCSLRTAPSDRRLTDDEWAAVARDVVHRTGFARRDEEDSGCRWVAVRHADDHIHVVVTLARQDGRRVSTSNDYYRLGEACRRAEREYGLLVTPPRDRTADKRPTRAETEKTARQGESVPARMQLLREVRVAAAAAADPEDFLQRLSGAGLLVRPRRSQNTQGQITGYSVALPGHRTAAGHPVWYGGSKLATDLSWTKLSSVWAAEPASLASDTADLLQLAARRQEGRRGGPLTEAAATFERARREPFNRPPGLMDHQRLLRSAAKALRANNHGMPPEARSLERLVDLVVAVARLRAAQGRTAQGHAARAATAALRAHLGASPSSAYQPGWVPSSRLSESAPVGRR
ncbi:relaxase/mobilization nuclease domain-containing protein [Angustibacter luteus]|uniref:Relaxase/mobilization nuclease domain-containing protein n=1 Tax=Angustibacter luteus TaxID=658456 RepID=A0ABW1JFH2_9ACTN